MALVLSCEFWKISKNTIYTEHLQTTVSVFSSLFLEIVYQKQIARKPQTRPHWQSNMVLEQSDKMYVTKNSKFDTTFNKLKTNHRKYYS